MGFFPLSRPVVLNATMCWILHAQVMINAGRMLPALLRADSLHMIARPVQIIGTWRVPRSQIRLPSMLTMHFCFG